VTRIELPEDGRGPRGVVGIRANNPSPFSLTGTNSWVVGRDPAWVVDPGPALEEHLDALAAELEQRGGLGGIALTHDHFDHSEAVPLLRERFPGARFVAARGDVDQLLADGDRAGPLEALYTPGHAPDHITYAVGDVAMTGDAVLGTGSVFIYPDPGALSGYLAGLERLKSRGFALLLPGHGPLVPDPRAKLGEYIAHRLEREARLVAALADGARSVDELLDRVWDDAPAALRPAAAVTLAAHLDKLEEEGRLPDGVERPSGWEGRAPQV
jgi:glyoxylase-like metal-dependent hydrolase (beta-lactamase superfamily II)